MLKFMSALLAGFLFVSGSVLAQNKSPEDIPISEFASLQKNSQVRLSPDGKYVSTVFFMDGNRHLLINPIGDTEGRPVVIPPYEGMDIDFARWFNNDRLVIRMIFEKEAHSALGTVNASRLISIRKDGQGPENMAKPAKIKGSRRQNYTYMPDWAGTIIDTLPNDPEHFLLAIDEDQSDQALEIRKVNIETGNYDLILDFYGDIQSWLTDQEGIPRLGEGFRRTGSSGRGEISILFYLPPGESEWLDYTDTDTNKNYSILGFYEDPRFAYATGASEHGTRALYKYDMVNQEEVETIFSLENYDVGSLRYDPHTGKPIGIYYTTTKPEIHYFDKELARYQAMIEKALANTIISLTSWTRDRSRFIVHSESDIDSGAYYLFDVESKQLAFIETSYEGLDPRLLSPRNPVEYVARDGLTIPAYLTIPQEKEGQKLPTVILPHGGPQARDEWGYDFLSQFLASRGYAVLQPNFRGSTGYGKDFAKAGRHQWGLRMQDDVTDGAKWLIEEGIADPERICIMGWSYGGYAALIGSYKNTDLYKCSISINGVSDLSQLLYDDRNFLGLQQWGSHIGSRDDKEKLEANSAYYNIEKVGMPVLLIANKDDARVNYKQSEDMAEKLEDAGKPVQYVEIEEGGHSALTGPARKPILEEVEKFLERHIGGDS